MLFEAILSSVLLIELKLAKFLYNPLINGKDLQTLKKITVISGSWFDIPTFVWLWVIFAKSIKIKIINISNKYRGKDTKLKFWI